MKKKICIYTILIIFFFLSILVILNHYRIIDYSNFIVKNTIRKNEESVEEEFIIHKATIVEKPEESQEITYKNGVKISGIVNSRKSTNLNVTLHVKTEHCIKSITCGDKEYKNEKNENDMRLQNIDVSASFIEELPIKIKYYSDKIDEINVKTNTLKIQNKKPSNPVIDVWPMVPEVKRGRKVVLKAKSTDENEDKINYVWTGRKAEEATYEPGEHTIKVKAVDEFGYESEEVEYKFKVLNIEAGTSLFSKKGKYDFNILGKEKNGREFVTTYANQGYHVVFEPSDTKVELEVNADSVHDGNYIKVNYTVTNPTDTEATFRIGTHTDVQIDDNDRATIYNLEGDKGFNMNNGVYYYNVYLAHTPGVNDVSTYWYGHYGAAHSNCWNNGQRTPLIGTDSGMAYSWQNQKIGPKSTKVLSIIIGLE